MRSLDFSSKEYLPDSDKRIERLRRIIRGRPVAILAAGPSIKELENRVEELWDANICYFGFNNFFVQEKHILAKVNKQMEVTMGLCRESMPEAIDAIIDFLKRDQDNLFISSFISSFKHDTFGLLGDKFKLRSFLDVFDKRLLFASIAKRRSVPNSSRPLHFIESNSLLLLIQIALIGKASSIVLFGADGHCVDSNKDYYYQQKEYSPNITSKSHDCLVQDTEVYFNPIASIAIKNTCKTYKLPLVNILNCSENSYYAPFPRISYNDAYEYLVKGKRIVGKLDLRFPMKPRRPRPFLHSINRGVNFWQKYRWHSFSVLSMKIWGKLVKTGRKSINAR
jgi:hypothetical protein